MKKTIGLFLILVLVAPSMAAAEEKIAKEQKLEAAPNYGQDFTRPLTRVDARLKYKRTTDRSNVLENTYRAEHPFELKSGWQVLTRVDIPMIANDTKGPDNNEGHWTLGLGDVLTAAGLVSPEKDPFRYGAGLRVVWPTATEQGTGDGKYQLGPEAGIAYSPSFLPEGSFFEFTWREQFSVGGSKGRQDIHRSILTPGVTLNGPHQFFITSAPDIEINWADGGKVFMPVNLQVGRQFGHKVIISAEWNQGVVKEYENYDWNIEFRIGYFFDSLLELKNLRQAMQMNQ